MKQVIKYIDYLAEYEKAKKEVKTKSELFDLEEIYIKLGFVKPIYERIERNELTPKQIQELVDNNVIPKNEMKKKKQKAICGLIKHSCSKCSNKVYFTYEFSLCIDCFNKLPKKIGEDK